MSFVVLFPALLLQVLTRAEQLAAKKKAKSGAAEPEQEDKGNQGNKGATSDDNDSGDDFGCPTGFMKRPAARGRPPKAKATSKAAAKSKAKAEPKPKKKSESKKGKKEKKHKVEEEDEVDGDGDVADDAMDVDGDNGENATQDYKNYDDGDEYQEDAEEVKPKKAKGKGKAKDKSTRKRKNKTTKTDGDAVDDDDGASPDAHPAKRPRSKKPKVAPKDAAAPKRRARKSTPLPASVDDLADETMKGIVLQRLKSVKSMNVEDLKAYLISKKGDVGQDNARLNTDWSKTSSSIRLKHVEGFPTICSFTFKTGTWNSRMAAAYISSWLMVSLHQFPILR